MAREEFEGRAAERHRKNVFREKQPNFVSKIYIILKLSKHIHS